MSKKRNSPYTASITGGGFLFDETNVLLPLLQSEDSDALLHDEAIHNQLLHINAETSRKRAIAEIKRRYYVMSEAFWGDYEKMNKEDEQVALFFVILKTYKICFDLHVNVTMRRWNSVRKLVTHDDLMMEFNEIAASDAFVDSWSETTKGKVAGAYLTVLRKIRMLDTDSTLHPLSCSNFSYYINCGELWFLEACLLQPYEIENIKKQML